jgi:predicted kinase
VLVIFCGLPATGKTTLARVVARRLRATYFRVDTVEQVIRDAVDLSSVDDIGYRLGYAFAEDNLRLGQTVVADCVNPLQLTRDAWRAVAARVGVPAVELEITSSDRQEHRRRVETRRVDIAGLQLPSWQDIMTREYHPWTRDRVVIDRPAAPSMKCVAEIETALSPLARNHEQRA